LVWSIIVATDCQLRSSVGALGIERSLHDRQRNHYAEQPAFSG